uniref:Uncharacterized protein n=1 Tax=Anguilla anguilla TaxID=7936 RepID=A0A0E9T0X8_ANGAN
MRTQGLGSSVQASIGASWRSPP